MIGQLIAVAGFALLMLVLRERALYRDCNRPHARHDENAARASVRPRTGEVQASPVDCPIYPIEFARSRRAQRDGKPAA